MHSVSDLLSLCKCVNVGQVATSGGLDHFKFILESGIGQQHEHNDGTLHYLLPDLLASLVSHLVEVLGTLVDDSTLFIDLVLFNLGSGPVTHDATFCNFVDILESPQVVWIVSGAEEDKFLSSGSTAKTIHHEFVLLA